MYLKGCDQKKGVVAMAESFAAGEVRVSWQTLAAERGHAGEYYGRNWSADTGCGMPSVGGCAVREWKMAPEVSMPCGA
jgi:hypothetical protein